MTPGDWLRAVHGALVDAFDLADLDQLVTLNLGVTLEQVTGPDCTLEEAALALVRWAAKRGRAWELVKAAAEARPLHSGLRELAKLEPPAAQRMARGGAQGTHMEEFGPGSGNGEQRRLGEQIGKLAADVGYLQRDVAALRASVDTLIQRREPWTPGLWYVAVFIFGIALAAGVFFVAFQ